MELQPHERKRDTGPQTSTTMLTKAPRCVPRWVRANPTHRSLRRLKSFRNKGPQAGSFPAGIQKDVFRVLTQGPLVPLALRNQPQALMQYPHREPKQNCDVQRSSRFSSRAHKKRNSLITSPSLRSHPSSYLVPLC